MLTAKKLIDYLKQFPDDTPIYYMEIGNKFQTLASIEMQTKNQLMETS